MTNQSTTTLVAIAGASGAGKSRLAERVYKCFAESKYNDKVRLVHEDSYYRDQSHLPFVEREKTNYDHPDAFEHELLVQHLLSFLNGESVEIPEYDYAVHNRAEQTTKLEPGAILIVEGILILHDPRIRKLLDVKIFVDVPLDVCLLRRIRRDSVERGRDLASILDQFENSVRPMYVQYVAPSKKFADIIVPNGGDNEFAVQLLQEYLKNRV